MNHGTLTPELEKRAKAFEDEMILSVIEHFVQRHDTSEEVRTKTQASNGEFDEQILVKKRKLRWFCHVSRSSGPTRHSDSERKKKKS